MLVKEGPECTSSLWTFKIHFDLNEADTKIAYILPTTFLSYEKCCIFIHTSLKLLPIGPINLY